MPTDHGLAWGVRRSLVDYVQGLHDGAIAVGSGVVVAPELEFRFPLDDVVDFDGASRLGVVRFRGTVQFTGHFGMMNFTFADPWLHVGATSSSLSVDALDGPGSRATLLEIDAAQSAEDGDTLRWVALRPTLAESGAAFLDFFPVGTEFDALSARMPLQQ